MWRSAVQVCLGLHFDNVVLLVGILDDIHIYNNSLYGGLAQLARALAWHARGHRFDPDILHVRGGKWKNPLPYLYKIFDILTQARL